MHHHGAAIAIRKVRYSETSLIVTWLTGNHGKVKTVARGALRAKSPFRGVVDLFHKVEIGWKESAKGELHTLTEARLDVPFTPAAPGYPGTDLAAYFASVTDLATHPGEPVPAVHDLLSRALDHLGTHPASLRALLHFEKELCRALGVFDSAGLEAPEETLRHYAGRLPEARSMLIRRFAERVPPDS